MSGLSSKRYGKRSAGNDHMDVDDDMYTDDDDDRLSLDEVDDTLEVDQLEDFSNRDNVDDDAESDYADSEYEADAELKQDDLQSEQPDIDYFSEDRGIVMETIVPEEERITSNILSRYEMVELVSTRAKQISQNPVCFVDVDGIKDPVQMALKEIYSNRCPLLVKREIGVNTYEIWDPNTMIKQQL